MEDIKNRIRERQIDFWTGFAIGILGGAFIMLIIVSNL